jgi:FRG domain
MNDIIVNSWNELNEQLYEGSWHPRLGRFRSTSAFRGMSHADYDLRTSLARLGGRAGQLEEHMLRAFRKYASRQILSDYSIWNWLAVAQHHGLSTRLLDWTYSPLVAMHFATRDFKRFDFDGVIWAVDFVRTNELLPDVLKKILAEEGSDVFTAEMLARVVASLSQFDRLSNQPFVAFFEPPSLDDRIVNQYALFSLVSDPLLNLDAWLSEHPDVYRRIIICDSLKWEVRDKLDQANVTERVLFPGLDGLSDWLNRYYTPREGRGPEEEPNQA